MTDWVLCDWANLGIRDNMETSEESDYSWPFLKKETFKLHTSSFTYCDWCTKQICPAQFTKQTLKLERITIDSLFLLVKQKTLEQHQVMTTWLLVGYFDTAFIKMDVPERCHRLAVVNRAEQLAIVTDTKTHVSFSLLSWSIWTENALLFPEGAGHKGRQRENARICPKLYTYSALCLAGIC